jgi:hypothetical protein
VALNLRRTQNSAETVAPSRKKNENVRSKITDQTSFSIVHLYAILLRV